MQEVGIIESFWGSFMSAGEKIVIFNINVSNAAILLNP